MGQVELIIVKGDAKDCIEVLNNYHEGTSVESSTVVKAPASEKSEPVADVKAQREELKAQAGVANTSKKSKRSKKSKKKSTPKVEEPKVEEPKVEEPKVEEPKVEEPKAEEPKVEEPKVEEPKAEEPKVEEPPESEGTMTEQEFMDNMRDLYVKYKSKNGPKAMMTVIKEEGGYKSFVEVPASKYEEVVKKCKYVLEQL